MQWPARGTTVGRWAMAATAAALMTFTVSVPARADAVPPPPEQCLAGSEGDSCHGGDYCRPDRCTDESDCSGNDICRELQLCIGRVDCAGGWDPEAGPSWQDTVEGSCANGATCTRGTCETVHVCAPPEGTSTGTGASGSDGSVVVDQGCGCRLGGRPPTRGVLGAASLACLGLCLARRRRRG